MGSLNFQLITAGTEAYEEMVCLRMQVLLGPIGIPRQYINEEKEAGDILLGAYQNEQLVGCCILTRVNSETVQLRQMAVAADRQGSGIGRQMLTFAENEARRHGYTVLMMHARDTVLPFYQKCGYTVYGHPFSEVGIPHHNMQKHLSIVGENH
jgi:predicted GNAT family N-acyltransferase